MGVGVLMVLGAVTLGWYVIAREQANRRAVRARILPSGDAVLAGRDGPRRDVLARIGEPLTRMVSEVYADKMQARISKAAMGDTWSVPRVLGAKLLAATGLLLFGWIRVQADPTPMNVTLMLGGAMVGFLGPDALLNTRGDARSERIQTDLADVIDQLAVTVKAGLGLNAALERLGRSVKGEIGEEINRVNQDIRLGSSRREALEAMAARVDILELTMFVRALAQAGELGLPIATTLSVQAEDMRLRRRQRAEEKAMALPIKLMFPTVLCILPALLIVVIGPAVMSAFEGFSGI
ncbi:MAG: type II secretion system F family protein [Actinomycetota bacterium]